MLSRENSLSTDNCFSWTAASLNRVIMNSSSKDRMWEKEVEDVFWKTNNLTLSLSGYKSSCRDVLWCRCWMNQKISDFFSNGLISGTFFKQRSWDTVDRKRSGLFKTLKKVLTYPLRLPPNPETGSCRGSGVVFEAALHPPSSWLELCW